MADRPAFVQQTSQVHMDMNMTDQHIDTMATPTLWEKSYLCPCRNKKTRQPNPACKTCRGRGIAYLPPKPLKVIVQSQQKDVFNGDLGIIDAGTAIGTPDRLCKVSFRDRITLKLASVSQSFIFDVTQKRIDNGFYMVYDVKEIELAVTTAGELVEGEDYTVDLPNNLFYPKEHLLGENISINISTTLRYMVADLLKEHRYAKQPDKSFEDNPQKLLLKREDIFIDKEAFSLGVEDQEIKEMIDTKRQPSVDGLNGFFRTRGL